MAELLNIPFNESNGATEAADISGNGYNATVENATFVAGQSGNCIHFEGTGKAEIDQDILDLSGDFTILAWVKPSTLADGFTGTKLGLFCNTAELEGSQVIWTDALAGTWGFVAIKKSGSSVSLYVDGALEGSITLTATLTGISLLQDIYSDEYAVADMDEVKIFDTVLSDDEINEILSGEEKRTVEYYIDGVNFREFGIRVESSTGVVDLPSLKTPPEVENDNYHGRMIDLRDKRYQQREITLNCWLKASGKMDFVNKLRAFYDIFDREGTQRLMIDFHPTKPLVYDVFCEEGIAHEKRWHENLMIGTFSLKLKEPDPVKRVIRVRGSEVSVSFNSNKLISVSWGDQSENESVHGEVSLSHTYDEAGIYYVIVAGVLEEITDFETSGTVVWQRV